MSRLAGIGLLNWVIIIIFLLLVGLMLVSWLPLWWPYHQEQQAIEEIERLGGTAADKNTLSPYRSRSEDVYFKRVRLIDFSDTQIGDEDLGHVLAMAGFEKLEGIDLTNTHISDTGLKYLGGLPQLSYVEVANTHITDAGLESLQELPELFSLNLSKTQISDAGLVHLSDMRSLGVLALSRTTIGDAGLAHLTGIKLWQLSLYETDIGDAGLASLREHRLGYLDVGSTQISNQGLAHLRDQESLHFLNIGKTQVGDAGLEHLHGLTMLQSLGLHGTRISDDGLEQLAKLSSLRRLWLMKTEVSDSGLGHLQGLTKLEGLYLAETQISDAGLEQLQGLTNLRYLGVEGTNVTETGLDHLLESLPECEIFLVASGGGRAMAEQSYPSYAEFVTFKQRGLRNEAIQAAQRVVEEYVDSPRDDFPIMLCSDVEFKINHILWRGIVLPFVKPRLHDDPRAIKCLIATIQNFYSDKSAMKELAGVHEEQLILRYLEFCPHDEWAIERRRRLLVNWLEYTIHEWPAGVLYDNNGADESQCREILDAVQDLREIDKAGEYTTFCDDVQAKTVKYLKRLADKTSNR